jgi:uncharacterized membrane protein
VVKEFLQGKWLGHPLHPALVHVPVGAWTAALIFDLCSIGGVGQNAMVVTSFTCILIGCVVALLAAPTGLADWMEIKPEKPAYKLGLVHMVLNVLVLGLFIANLVIRWNHVRTAQRVSSLELSLTVIAFILLGISAYLGGLMVFDHGISIARMSKKKWRAVAERGNARLPEVKGS